MKNREIMIKRILLSVIMCLTLGLLSSCSDDINRPDEWPEWPGKSVVKINGKELSDTYYEKFNGMRVSLSEGAAVNFEGLGKLKYSLQNHFWDVQGDDKAVFKGAAGEYDLIYDHLNSLLYVENPEVKYPDALYVIGEQLGHSGATESISTSWSIDAPDNVQSCRKISQDKYQISLYLASGFKFKFFKHHGWGDHGVIEIWAEDLTLNQPTLITGTGDFCAGPLFQAGVYDITVDLAAKTLDMESRVPVPEEEFFVNGELMQPWGQYLHVHKKFTKGEEVVFSNFGGISEMVQPEFYDVKSDVEGKAVFLGLSGDYDIYFDVANMLIYTEAPTMNGFNGECMWVTGDGLGHPKAKGATVGSWKLTEPTGSIQMKKAGEGIYEATLYLREGFCAKFYKNRDWGSASSTELVEPMPASLFRKGISGTQEHCVFTGDLIPGDSFKAGVYTVRADYNNKIVYAVGHLSDDLIRSVEYKVNGVPMTDSKYAGFKEVVLNLTKGQKMKFENLPDIDYMLQPEYYEKQGDGSYVFKAMSGEYRLIYDADVSEYIWTERTSQNGLWITGQYFGHPKFGGWNAGDPNNSPYVSPGWSWDNPRQYLCCAEISSGVYETTFILHSSWAQLTLYGERGWSNVLKSSEVNITDTSSFGRSYFWSDGVGNDTNFGCTVGNIGEQYGVYRLHIDTNKTPVEVKPVLMDGFGHH